MCLCVYVSECAHAWLIDIKIYELRWVPATEGGGLNERERDWEQEEGTRLHSASHFYQNCEKCNESKLK